MGETVNKFLLAGDKFMAEMRITHSEFTYSACRLFNEYTKLKKQQFWGIFIKMK